MDIVWEEILMRFIYTPNRTDIIVEHEIMMLKEYSKIISKYSDMFAQYGCSLNVGCVWNNSLKKNISNSRTSFQNGYACYIYCDVLKDGNVLRYNTYDGEADYYEATVSWNISSIERSFFHLTVTLYSEIDGIHDEIMQLLKVVEAL